MATGSASQDQNESFLTIAPLMESRHSGREYDNTKLVTADQIKALSEAARLAPSCYNDQPWFFILCDRTTQPEAYKKVMNCLVEFNQGWAKNAPLLVVVLADSKFEKSQKLNRWGSYDTGAAAFSMALQAAHMGLMAHQMGGFDEDKIRKEFSIPSSVTPMAIMAIGYEQAGAQVPLKDRRPLTDNFFLGAWGGKSAGSTTQ